MLGVALTVWHYILKVPDEIGHCRFVNFDRLVPKVSSPTLQSRVLKIDKKFQLSEMAHAKKVKFHILSQIVFPVDFGPGVLGPLAPKGQN